MQTKFNSTISDIKDSAKNFLAGKYYTAVMTFLFYFMLLLLFSRFSQALTTQFCLTLMGLSGLSESSPVIVVMTYLIPYVVSSLQNMIQIGMCLFFLNMACHQNYNTFDLLYGFSHNFGRNFCLSAIMTFFSYFALLPTNLLLEIYLGKRSSSENTYVILLLLQAVFALLYYVIYLSFSQIYYISLDHPELSVKDILRQSAKIMKGKKAELFLLDLSFLPLSFLAIPTFGIGLFWILPYREMAHSVFFLRLMNAEIEIQDNPHY